MPTATASAADKLLNLYESAQASSLLRDWARADAAFAEALAITRASPNSSARAERAVALTQAQSLLDRGAPAQAPKELMRAYAGDGSRPVHCCCRRRSPWPRSPPSRPTAPSLRRGAGDLQTWVALHPDDSLAWGSLGQTWGRARPAAARAARRGRDRATRSATSLGAVDRLRAAQRLARSGGPVDFIDASVVDSRLRDIEAQRRQIEPITARGR